MITGKRNFRKFLALGGCVLVASALGCSNRLYRPDQQSQSQSNANIVFVGDSVTAGWSLPTTNLAVSHETSTDIAARSTAVKALAPYAVVILAGTDDARLGIAPATTIANIQTMVQNASNTGAKVYVGTVPVAASSDPAVAAVSQNIADYNAQIRSLGASGNVTLVDYAKAMDSHPEYFTGGIYPNAAGYAAMQKVLSSQLDLSL